MSQTVKHPGEFGAYCEKHNLHADRALDKDNTKFFTTQDGTVMASKNIVERDEEGAAVNIVYTIDLHLDGDTWNGYHLRVAFTDNDGDSYTADHLILETSGEDAEALKEKLQALYPSEHCQHSHDCCGQWYQGSVRVKEITKYTDGDRQLFAGFGIHLVHVTIPYSCNV